MQREQAGEATVRLPAAALDAAMRVTIQIAALHMMFYFCYKLKGQPCANTVCRR